MTALSSNKPIGGSAQSLRTSVTKSSQHRGTNGLAFQIDPPAREHCLDQSLFRRRQITRERRLRTAHIAQFLG